MGRIRSRWLAGLTAATIVFGVAFAAAASLGVSSDGLSAGQDVVVSCDTNGVATSYTTTYDTGANAYLVTTVTVSGVDVACDGVAYAITLEAPSGTANEFTGTITLSGGSFDVDVSGAGVDAGDVVNIAIALAG
jgi:redox-regulated HSP33 family molecular chaperone